MESPPHWLTANRLRAYTGITLALMAVALTGLTVTASLNGWADPAGRPLGNDFMAFWSAARLAVMGDPAAVTDVARLTAMGHTAVPGMTVSYVFSYPPVFTLLLMPLGLLAYPAALAVWSALGLTAYLVTILLTAANSLRPPRIPLIVALALAFPAAFLTLAQGQTGFFSTALIGGGLILLSRRPEWGWGWGWGWTGEILAGGLLALACVKPHLCLLLPVILIAGRYGRAILSAGITGLGLCLASGWGMGWEPWTAFIGALHTASTLLETGAVPWTKMPSPFAALRLAGASVDVAYAVQAAFALVAAAIVAVAWRRRPGAPMTVALSLCAVLMVPPHLNDHDLVMLAIPVALVARDGLRHGWLWGEREALLAVAIAPVLLAPLASLSGLQAGPLLLVASLALVLRRAARAPIGAAPTPP